MVPFDYTDTKQSNLQKPQPTGIDAMLSNLTFVTGDQYKSLDDIQETTKVNSPMRGRLDHIPEVLGSRHSRPLLTAVGRNQKLCATNASERNRALNIQYFTTAIHSPKRPQLVLATGSSWNRTSFREGSCTMRQSTTEQFRHRIRQTNITSFSIHDIISQKSMTVSDYARKQLEVKMLQNSDTKQN